MQDSSTLQSPWHRFFQNLLKMDAETKQRAVIGFITGLGFMVGIAFVSLTILRDQNNQIDDPTPIEQEIAKSLVQDDDKAETMENLPVEVGEVQYYAHEPSNTGAPRLDAASLEALRAKLNKISGRIEQLESESSSLQNQLASDRAQVKNLSEPAPGSSDKSARK